jgi:hypothetical protein
MAAAINSLPVPLSPVSRTGTSRSAAFLARPAAIRIAGLSPRICSNPCNSAGPQAATAWQDEQQIYKSQMSLALSAFGGRRKALGAAAV